MCMLCDKNVAGDSSVGEGKASFHELFSSSGMAKLALPRSPESARHDCEIAPPLLLTKNLPEIMKWVAPGDLAGRAEPKPFR